MTRTAQVRITAWNARFDEGDDRVLRQRDELFGELHRDTGSLVQRQVPGPPGAKGAAVDTLLMLASPAVVAGAVSVTKAWLGRDRDRRVRVDWEAADGQLRSVVVDGNAVDSETMRVALEQALGDQRRTLEGQQADGNG
ncbi:hypothetical protein [Streptomyces sp. NPDC088400]|uniref:effector-associated constant component EACC1 n=1 Tax=Streptomyces sp. NPDC088400 TaxID=3365861 RepID=UPI00382F9634